MVHTDTDPWPALPLAPWRDTRDTLQLWTQIVGKTRLAYAPMQNHWWQVTLYPTARGLTTGAMPCGGRTVDVTFDFIAHTLDSLAGKAVSKLTNRVQEGASDLTNEATRMSNKAIKRVSREIDRRPLLTLAIAAGVGYLAGMAMRRQ